MYDFEVTSEPAVEPVTLEEAKGWLRLDGTTDSDERVLDLITGARIAMQDWTGLSFITQTVAIYPPCFEGEMLLPTYPVSSISSITYYDLNDTQQTYSSDNYELDAKAAPARLRAKWNQTWPSIYDRYNPITITAVVGYGGRESVPETVKMAIKAIVSLWHDNDTTYMSRSSMQESEMPYGVRAMINQLKVPHYD